MKDIQIWAYDTQGSLQAVRSNPDGILLSALDVSDITLDTDLDLDSLNGNTIATNSGVVNDGTLRVTIATDVGTSVNISGFSSTIGANIINSDGATIDLRDRNWTITETVPISTGNTLEVKQLSGSVDSINVLQLNGNTINAGAGTVGTGTQRMVMGSDSTTMVVGNVNSDAADDETPPIKIGGIARTANPTAVAAGDRVSATFDDVGRQVVGLYQVRDLTTTAYATLNTNTETNLLAGAASTFHDLVYIMGANTSSGAVSFDVRDATGGGVIATINCAAEATAGMAPIVPIPQNVVADTWTVDFNDTDISNTTVYVSALFIKNV